MPFVREQSGGTLTNIDILIKYRYLSDIGSSTSSTYYPIELFKGASKVLYVNGDGRVQIQTYNGSTVVDYLGTISSSNREIAIPSSNITHIRLITGGSTEQTAYSYSITIRFE